MSMEVAGAGSRGAHRCADRTSPTSSFPAWSQGVYVALPQQQTELPRKGQVLKRASWAVLANHGAISQACWVAPAVQFSKLGQPPCTAKGVPRECLRLPESKGHPSQQLAHQRRGKLPGLPSQSPEPRAGEAPWFLTEEEVALHWLASDMKKRRVLLRLNSNKHGRPSATCPAHHFAGKEVVWLCGTFRDRVPLDPSCWGAAGSRRPFCAGGFKSRLLKKH